MSDPGFPKSTSLTYGTSGGWTRPNGQNFSQYSDVTSYVAKTEDKASSDTPGWPTAIRENPYWHSGSLVQESPASWSGIITGGPDVGSQGSGTWPLFHGITVPLSMQNNIAASGASCRLKVLNKLITNIKGQKFNAAVALAESHQTANLIASTANRLAQTYLALRHGNVRTAVMSLFGTTSYSIERGVRRYSGAPQQWLALQYGWRPLLSDVYGACQQLAERYAEKPPYLSSRASASETLSTVSAISGTFGLPMKWTQHAQAHSYGFIEYSVGNSLASTASQTGITNPLSVAWELLPYSFVVDWFYPVGSYLNNLDYHLGLDFHRGWIVVKLHNNVKLTLVSGHRVSGSTTQDFSGGSHSEDGNSYNRTVETSFPAVPPPELKNPFSPTHVANALSLLATAFGR